MTILTLLVKYLVIFHADLCNKSYVLTPRVIVYCNTLLTCAELFDYFSYGMGINQYYPPGAPELRVNQLLGMFHAKTPQRSRDNIVRSLQNPNGVVRVVFASVAIGMGVDLQGVNIILCYGAPSSIENYFQVRIYTDPVIFGFKIVQFLFPNFY